MNYRTHLWAADSQVYLTEEPVDNVTVFRTLKEAKREVIEHLSGEINYLRSTRDYVRDVRVKDLLVWDKSMEW